jgi:hopanoid biosynthesis associated protein HpnK
MADVKPRRRLIVNADDFGRSESINQAVIQARQRGVLTTASLMVTGAAFESAARLARENPRLGVGLHLTLCRGRSVLPASEIPTLVDRNQNFRDSPIAAGFKYFFSTRARLEIAREVAAQFARFLETGLPLDHVNGHLHFHLHPAVFQPWKCRAVRLVFDPLRIDFPLGAGRPVYRLGHALIFSWLSRRARPRLRGASIAHTDFTFGLLENERVTEDYILKLLRVLPAGDSELYSHPSLDHFEHEYQALVSPRVREAIQREEIELIRYQDLWPNSSSSFSSRSRSKPSA